MKGVFDVFLAKGQDLKALGLPRPEIWNAFRMESLSMKSSVDENQFFHVKYYSL